MKYVELRSGSKPLFLIEQEVAKPKSLKPVPESLNHIIITDVSGSMYNLLPGLSNDLAKHVRKLPKGDTVSFGWFSGEGSYRFVLKGFKLTEDKDYDSLENTIRKELYTRGTTCFSEILHDTDKVIEDLSAVNSAFALTFFTDGYPVVSNYEREVKSITSAIEKLQGKVSSALLVGYGDYYNKELMATMAQEFGGSLIHSGDLNSFSASFDTFLDDSRENGLKVVVKIDADISENDKVFSINGKQVVLYSPQKDGTVTFVPTKKSKDFLYAITSVLPKDSKEVLFTDTNVKGKSPEVESLVKAAYAASYILTQSTKTDLALEVLATLGDKSLIDIVNNSYTNAEYGKAESQIATAMASPSKRFPKGRDVNYLPAANAFCLLDVLEILMNDDKACFYPQDDRFDYNRISRAVKTKPGYPEFKPDSLAKCDLSSLVWNDKKLNLSVKTKIDGIVELKDAKKYGLQEQYQTYVFRNYSLVKDGFLNVQKLPVSLSEGSFNVLQSHGVIEPTENWGDKDKVVVLDLTQVPVINRLIAEGKTSAEKLCIKAMQEITLEGQLKSLRYLQKELSVGVPYKDTGVFTAEQVKFLEDNGITKNGFNPPTEREESTDSYMAKEFEIKIKGFSSLPSMADVLKKFDVPNKKVTTALTPSQSIVAKGLQDFWVSGVTNSSPKVQLAWVDDEIKKRTSVLLDVRRDIQETKFAVILGKRWFDEFKSREDNTLTVDGHVLGMNDPQTFNIVVREVQVNI